MLNINLNLSLKQLFKLEELTESNQELNDLIKQAVTDRCNELDRAKRESERSEDMIFNCG